MSQTKSHSKKKIFYSPMGGVIILALTGLIIMGGFYWNEKATVKKVQYKGNHIITKQELKSKTHIPLGIHPDSLHTTAITAGIKQLPYVKNVWLKPQPGGTMIVQIAERTPLALLVDGSKRTYVDAHGICLPKADGYTPDVPLLYGFKARPAGDTLRSPAFKKIGVFLHALHAHKASDATISEIAWNNKKGVIALTNDNGVKLMIGKADFDRRLRNWQVFYRKVIKHKGIAKMQTVDLRFKGQIVTREK